MKKQNYSYPEFFQRILPTAPDDFAEILNFTDACPPGPVLEIGAGTGRSLGIIKSRPHHLLEPDQEMVAIMRNHPSAGLSNVSIINESFPYRALESEFYSAIYMVYGTIGELNPICVCLSEMFRILQPGGCVLISAINPLTFKASSLGIYRSKACRGKLDLSEVSYTIPVRDLGEGEYQTHLWRREDGFSQHFTVRQYFPSIDKWLFMIKESGFELISELESLNSSSEITIKLKKPVSDRNHKTKLAIEKVYDAMAERYDEAISKASYGMEPWLSPKLNDLVGLHPRVVDLACGTGLVGDLFERKQIKFSQLIGYDISEQMVNTCVQRNIYSDVCRLDLSTGLPGVGALTTDIITAFGFLEFVPDDEFVLKDLRRALVIGGELLCTFEYCPTGAKEDYVSIVANGHELKRRRRSIESVKQILISSGFGITEIELRAGYRSPTNGLDVEYVFVHAKREVL